MYKRHSLQNLPKFFYILDIFLLSAYKKKIDALEVEVWNLRDLCLTERKKKVFSPSSFCLVSECVFEVMILF